MIRIDTIWLALGASDLRGGIDRLLAMVVHGFALGAQAHHAYVFANRRAGRVRTRGGSSSAASSSTGSLPGCRGSG